MEKNICIIYRNQHLNTLVKGFELLCCEKIQPIVYPSWKFFFTNKNQIKRAIFFSTDSYWERLTFRMLYSKGTIELWYVQHGHLVNKAQSIGNRFTLEKIFNRLYCYFLGICSFTIFKKFEHKYTKAILFSPYYKNVLEDSRKITFTKTFYGYWQDWISINESKGDVLIIHENFISAGISRVNHSKEIEILNHIYDELNKINISCKILIHPMDRENRIYDLLKGVINYNGPVESIINGFHNIVGLYSSSLLYAQIQNLRIHGLNIYEIPKDNLDFKFSSYSESAKELLDSIKLAETPILINNYYINKIDKNEIREEF
jgi:hypothetical protein